MHSLCFSRTLFGLFLHLPLALVVTITWLGVSVDKIYASEQSLSAETLTFEKAVEIALGNAFDVRRADVGLALAEANQAILSHELDPRWVLSGSMSELRPRNTNLLMNNVGNAARTGSAVSLQLTGVIYDFGRHAARMAQAERQKEMQALTREDVTLSLRFRVARAYAAWVEAERMLLISEEQIKISESRVSQQEVNYRKGLRPEHEVVAAQLDLGRAKLVRERSLTEVLRARQRLADLINNKNATGSTGSLRLPKHLLKPQSPHAWDGLVKISSGDLGLTPSDNRRAKEVEALSHEEELIRRNRRPTLSGSIQAQHIIPWEGKGRDLVSGQIQLSWDIPWNGMDRDEIRRVSLRRQDLNLATEEEAQSRRERELQALLTWQMARAQWQGIQRQVELTKKQRDLIQRRYASGKASALELSSAEADDVSQQLELIRLQSTLAMAFIDIAEARGIQDLGGVFR
jgi:outer membrane protein TolC